MNNAELIKAMQVAEHIQLIEPPYKRKYPPLGLMKIAGWCRDQGKSFEFSRGPIPSSADLVMIATLFTYDWEIYRQAIDETLFLNPNARIIVGGVAASVDPKRFEALSPQVSAFPGFSETLDESPPNYDVNWEVEDRWSDWSYLFSTRGCPNNCAYCFVPKIEKASHVCQNWRAHIDTSKKFVMLFDNNLTAFGAEHVRNVAEFCNEHKLKVRLDNAVDCKFIDDEMAKAIASIPLERRGIRTAFDRIEEDGVFQRSIETMLKHGVSKYNIMAYVLYNFSDTPQEANYRCSECLRLGIAPYPAQFRPINDFDRGTAYISPKWTPTLARNFRFFWLMNGYYRKMTFVEFLESDKCQNKMSAEDWAAWRA